MKSTRGYQRNDSSGSLTSVNSNTNRRGSSLRKDRGTRASSAAAEQGLSSSTPATFTAGPKARRVRMYRNGDQYYSGLQVVLAADNFRTYDSLLLYMNKSTLANPAVLNKGVRYIYTIKGKLITSLEQMEDGGSYVCASTLAFRPLDYEHIHSPTWIKQFKATIKGIGEIGIDDYPVGPRDFITPRTICVFRAGPRPRNRVKTMLNRRTAKNYDQLLSNLAEGLGEPGPIKSICALSGKLVVTLKDFFADEMIFVAFSAEKYSPDELILSDEEQKYISKYMIHSSGKTVLKQDIVRSASDINHVVKCSGSASTQNSDLAAVSRPLTSFESSRPSYIDDELGEIPSKILEKYRLGKLIYKMDAITVRKCDDLLKSTDAQLVLRVIDKTEVASTMQALLSAEAAVLRQLRHPNLGGPVEEVETLFKLCHVFELSSGIDLLHHVYNLSHYTEKDASKLVAQLVTGLSYLHSLDIMHRHVKPTNVMVTTDVTGAVNLKLHDFSLAVPVTGPLFQVCGTPAYMAPEMVCGIGYGIKADMWSVGITAYILLSGYAPYIGATEDELFRNIAASQVTFDKPVWDSISTLAKDLIVFMLEENPQNRSTATEVLDHTWVSRDIASELDIRPLVVQNLSNLADLTSGSNSRQLALSLVTTTPLDRQPTHYRSITSHQSTSGAPPTAFNKELMTVGNLESGEGQCRVSGGGASPRSASRTSTPRNVPLPDRHVI